MQNVAQATYRQILEQRSKENGIDFAEGVATAITPMAFSEIVMARSYQNLVDADTRVDIKAGIAAATRLQALIDSHNNQPNMAEIIEQFEQIVEAIRSTVPEDLWPRIVAKLPNSATRTSFAESDEDEAFDRDDGDFVDILDEDDDF